MRHSALWLCVSASLSIGCSDTPSRLQQQTLNSSSAAEEAIKANDKDGDGNLSAIELDGIPSIKSDLNQFDLDKNQSVNASEIAARIDRWQALKVALVPCSFVVKLDGKPLPDAEVKLEPEPFFASSLPMCEGKTDAGGRVSPSKNETAGSDPSAGLTGVPPGLYKLKITHPKLNKLAKYNTETVLGLQVAPDNPNLMLLEFSLSSN